MDAPRMLAPCDLARHWGCSIRTVLRLLAPRGELPCVRLNRQTILVAEIDAAAFYALRFSNLSAVGSVRSRRGRPWAARSTT
jgi:hypothetical protein